MDYSEVYKNCLEYFNQDTLAASTFVNKYILRDKERNFLEPDPDYSLRKRIVPEFARIENQYTNPLSQEDIYQYFKDFKYIVPQGSPLFGIGNNYQYISLSNCFVVGQPYDSYGGIFKMDEKLAQIQKRRGGVGIDCSSLRPEKTSVQNSAFSSDGVLSFMGRFSSTTEEVAQGGRRGALIITLDCRHPDVLSFIGAKEDLKKITGANISVRWHDDFFQAVEKDQTYKLRFPVDKDPEDAEIVQEVRAKEIFDEFVRQSWLTGEPGCLFWDSIINKSISDCYVSTSGVNPCGELPLHKNASCILMCQNLSSFVKNPFSKDCSFDWEFFEKSSRVATRLIDDLVDLEIEKVNKIIDKINSDPEPDFVKSQELDIWQKIKQNHIKYRKTGLGITALGDCLAMLNFKYGSGESINFIDKLFKFYQECIYDESATLASERGCFSEWDWEKEKNNYYIKKLPKNIQDKIKKNGRRNISSMTVAPTGSLSMITQTTSGIEPVIQLSYKRNRKMTSEDESFGLNPDSVDDNGIKWVSYYVEHEGVKKWKEIVGKENIEESPYYGSDSHSLDPFDRIKVQSTIQKHIDSSISSTINLKREIEQDRIKDIFIQGWKEGLKGITIFRDGSRMGVIDTGKTKNTEIIETSAPERPEVLPCDIHYSNIKCKQTEKTHKWIFLVGLFNGKVYEIFGGHRKSIEIPSKYSKGWIVKKKNSQYNLVLGSLNDENERLVIYDIPKTFEPDPGSYTRIISMSLRHGIPLTTICEQLSKDSDEADLFSFEKGISRVLRKYIRDGEKTGVVCPQCNTKSLEMHEGCMVCSNCGGGKCD